MDLTTKYKGKAERWSCGCALEYVEFNGQWFALYGDYCSYAKRLLDRGIRERKSPLVNVKRNADTYQKLLTIHRTKQELAISFE